MNDLLELAVNAHGGMVRWQKVKSIEVDLVISGGLMEIKGFPDRLSTSVTIDPDHPHTIMRPYAGSENFGVFATDEVSIRANAGAIIQERRNSRASFEGHVRATPWDQLHRLYFLGYAVWNYLTSPFLFTRPGFEIKELPPHEEDGESWRVLQVTYPPGIPTHCAVQSYYFNASGLLKRIDYVTDIAGGIASHYCYDHKQSGGIMFPTRRRVIGRTPQGPKISGPTAVFLDYISVRVQDA